MERHPIHNVVLQIGAKAAQEFLKKYNKNLVLAYTTEHGYYITDPTQEPPMQTGDGETASQVELYIDLTRPLEGVDTRAMNSPNPATIPMP